MPNELAVLNEGSFITLCFNTANPAASATVDMLLNGGQASDGPRVPAGHKFIPLYLFAESNAAITGGTATFRVHASGTEINNGPEVVLSSTAQLASAVARVTQSAGVAAGSDIGVSITTSGAYAPTTADHDAVLVGVFKPI